MSGLRDAASLELDGIEKTYGDVRAVEDLSLSLSGGELLVVVGPSGCGKSTTLRCIAGLEEPTGGDIRIAGQSVVGNRPEAREIAMVFQNYALYPHMTVRQNIGFGLKMTTDLSTAAVDRQVEETASVLDITELLDSKPKALSGGQRQRVALGRAIVRDPEVFLLDEPLSNLDATLRSRMRTEIQQLQRELGVTTLYVTHDQTEAMTMGDLIAVMRDGRLQQLGTPLECYHEPANEFVAGFIGEPSMNFFEFRYRDGRLIGDALEYAPTERMTEALTASGSRRVTLGIRPDDVDVVEDTSPDDRSFRGTVEVVEPVGERTLLYTDLSGLNLTVAIGGDVRVTEGATLDLRLPPDRVHLFDRESGAAVLHARRDDAEASVPGAEPGDG